MGSDDRLNALVEAMSKDDPSLTQMLEAILKDVPKALCYAADMHKMARSFMRTQGLLFLLGLVGMGAALLRPRYGVLDATAIAAWAMMAACGLGNVYLFRQDRQVTSKLLQWRKPTDLSSPGNLVAFNLDVCRMHVTLRRTMPYQGVLLRGAQVFNITAVVASVAKALGYVTRAW